MKKISFYYVSLSLFVYQLITLLQDLVEVVIYKNSGQELTFSLFIPSLLILLVLLITTIIGKLINKGVLKGGRTILIVLIYITLRTLANVPVYLMNITLLNNYPEGMVSEPFYTIAYMNLIFSLIVICVTTTIIVLKKESIKHEKKND